ncbi:MAG: NifB/NifX family molybdenum-iron cluster-binding protein [Eubacteriales bacterium]|nr:NifB/NifX family molybdenum-iron cluster-binding protein [Eubacteriales bacterium]
MKIAIASENGIVSAHFGHCEGFTVFETEDGVIKGHEFIPNPGHQPGFLPVFLKEAEVGVIIAGGMGGRAQDLFFENGIGVIVGAEGSCDEVMDRYIKGELKSTASVCDAHNHEQECGEH